MTSRHRRRAFHAEAIAPWVALSFILLLWWMGAQALNWLRPGQHYSLWSVNSDSTSVVEPKKVSKPLDAAAPAVAPPSARASEPTLTANSGITGNDIADLRARNLTIPVDGIPATALVSSFNDARSGHTHEAIDILAPRGTNVLAVEDGKIAKLFTSEAGGLTIYQFDPGDRFVYYYAHLNSYASGLREGADVKRGQVIGYVGTTGNAPETTPHLHFAISKLDADHRWWGGKPLDPYLVWRKE